MSRADIEGDGFSAVVAEPEAPPPRDHNNPPGLLIGEPLLQRVKLTHMALFKRGNDLLDAERRIPKAADGVTLLCQDDEQERKLTELSRQLATAHSSLDAARTAEIAPYRDSVNAVHGLFRDLMDKLLDPDKKTANSLRHRVERALTKYKSDKLEAERKRREAEAEAARLAEEAAQRQRDEEERKAREEEDRRRAVAAEEERKAQEAAAEAARVAARKRNEKAREEAEAEAERLRVIAAEAAEKRREEEEAAAADRRKRDEAAAEELARAAEKRAEAEAAATVPAANLTRTRSSNAMSGLQEFVAFRDLNRETLDLERLRGHIPNDALEQAMRSWIKANNDLIRDELKNRRQPVRGVVLYIDARTQTR